ncbi:MAG: hypothetical protein ACD_75C02330G0001, partial [uncultured bacterium]
MLPISNICPCSGLSGIDRYCGPNRRSVRLSRIYQMPVVTMMTVIGSRTFF